MTARRFGMAALAVAAMITGTGAQAAQSKLRVLYVGTDPQTVQASQREGENAQRRVELMKLRTPAFEKLLREHFATVKVVYAPQYKEALSADYDVTIFDAKPPVVRQESIERDAKTGQPVRMIPASYLSETFDRPAVLVGTVSASIGEGLRYKMDWLCECLDAHAHNVKFQHPVFNTPNRIRPVFEYRPTPGPYRMHDPGLPETLPMWRVQTEGYEDGKGMDIGLVSSGQGFEDGGDAEIISGGVNTKNMEAVALGRHGNFFHWGFAAAPDYMTPEGRLAFINAVHYIAKFKGQRPYSHRDFRVYARYMAVQVASAMSSPQAERALQLMPESLVKKFGKDYAKYKPYYEQNIDYVIAGPRPVSYEIDEDARSLGIPNHDPQLLELSVTMLESNFDTEKAGRILARYTGEKFQTAAQWRKWLDANRSRLYFSDVDGFRFHLKPAK